MKKIIIAVLLLLFVSAMAYSKPIDDDLSPLKMEKATLEILDLFMGEDTYKLRDYISEEWLESESLNVTDYSVNSYYPDDYSILFTISDVVVAEIWGEEWKHVLIFKFTDEDGEYRVIPKGISMVSDDYIDPWWDVRENVCREPIVPAEVNHDFEK
jgi:hypothetical protein